MANVAAQFGFQFIGDNEGSAPSHGQAARYIIGSYGTAIYNGDPVVFSAGQIQQAVNGGGQIEGIFIGCKYLSSSQGRTIWSPYYPGSDVASTTQIEAYIIDSPSALFRVSVTSGPALIAGINKTQDFNPGTGSTATGLSGATLVYGTATTNTLPFRMYNLWSTYQPSGNGTDNTTNFNWVVVGFNNQTFKGLNVGV